MNAIATGMWCGLAPVTENIDMSTPDKAGVAFRAIRPLVFAIGLLAGLSGTAVAQTGFCHGEIDFCDTQIIGGLTVPKWYDNTSPPQGYQKYGCFTDLPHSGWRPSNTNTITYRPPEISCLPEYEVDDSDSAESAGGKSVGGFTGQALAMRIEFLRRFAAHVQRQSRDVDHDRV